MSQSSNATRRYEGSYTSSGYTSRDGKIWQPYSNVPQKIQYPTSGQVRANGPQQPTLNPEWVAQNGTNPDTGTATTGTGAGGTSASGSAGTETQGQGDAAELGSAVTGMSLSDNGGEN